MSLSRADLLGDDPAQRAPADRLRRGLDDLAGLDRGPARRPGGAGRHHRGRRPGGPRRVAAGGRRVRARRPSPPTRSPTTPRCSRCRSTAPTSRSTTATPARVIVPALPGVHNTKWVKRMTFSRRDGEAGEPMRDRFRYEYGAQPLHLIAVAGQPAALRLRAAADHRDPRRRPGADLDRRRGAPPRPRRAAPLQRPLADRPGRRRGAIGSRAAMLLALNHVRIPAALSLLLLRRLPPADPAGGPRALQPTRPASAVDLYLGRWLLISAALFLISGIVYAIRLRRGVAEGELAAAAASSVRGARPGRPAGGRRPLAGRRRASSWRSPGWRRSGWSRR